MWVAYHNRRTVHTLDGLVRLTLQVRRCQNPACARYRRPYRPEAEGALGAAAARVRPGRHRPGRRAALSPSTAACPRSTSACARGASRSPSARSPTCSTATTSWWRCTWPTSARLRARLAEQGRVILALDGLQPDVGHEVLWVLRDCLSGEVLLARSLLRAAPRPTWPRCSREVARRAARADRRAWSPTASTRSARRWRAALPGVPHQLCQFHYLREAAQPIYEADRHAKKELKKQVRGVRPIERALEGRDGCRGRGGRAATAWRCAAP